MPKFTLIGEHTDLKQNPDGTKVQYEFNCDYLQEILEHFELFLRGCGFNPTGKLDFVPEQEYYGLDPEYGDHGGGSTLEDYPEINEWTRVRREDALAEGAEFHSQHYFDTERNK